MEDTECKRGYDLYMRYPEAFAALEEMDDDLVLRKHARKMHKMQKRIVSEECWASLENPRDVKDQRAVEKRCEPQYVALEPVCRALGDNMASNPECKRMMDLQARHPEMVDDEERPRRDDRPQRMQKRVVSEQCWQSFEAALAANDEDLYDKSCDGQFDGLEGYCNRLGDAAGADADCMRGWGLV